MAKSNALMMAVVQRSHAVCGLDHELPNLLHKYSENDRRTQAMPKSMTFTANKYDLRNWKQHFSEQVTLAEDAAIVQVQLKRSNDHSSAGDRDILFLSSQLATTRAGRVTRHSSAAASPSSSFNAAKFLFLSYRVAQKVQQQSTVARIVLNYSTPWPKQTYRHRANVQTGYRRKFAALSQSVSLIVLYFLSNLIVVPVSVRDLALQLATTVAAGYTVLVHLQLYAVYPVLVVVPTLCLGAIVHFVVQAQAGQAQVERSRLLQKIVDAEGVGGAYRATATATIDDATRRSANASTRCGGSYSGVNDVLDSGVCHRDTDRGHWWRWERLGVPAQRNLHHRHLC
eukprot:gene5380-6862_t